jgi:hypothetical protein
MEEVRNEFDELSFNVVCALNALMQCNEVCKYDKAVIKINRFKKWVISLQDEVEAGRKVNTGINE